MLPADCAALATPPPGKPVPGGLEQFLRALSVVTMLMTVPQVLAIWARRQRGIVLEQAPLTQLQWALVLAAQQRERSDVTSALSIRFLR